VSTLVEAIDHLVVAFGQVPRPTAIATCECCFTDDQARELLNPGAPPELVLQYAAYAMGTIGGVNDLRYFTPQILRLLLIDGHAGWVALEVFSERLRVAAWTGWPPPERDAVRGVLRALWAQTLATHPSDPDADTALCAIGNAEDDLDPYLADWTAALARGSAPAARHLWDLITWGVRSKGGRWRLTNAFWSHRDRPVGEWLSSDSTRAGIREGSHAAGDSDEAYTYLATFFGA
jgi:hypothetical protein